MDLVWVEQLLDRVGYRHSPLTWAGCLSGDGSDRRFIRCRFTGDPSVLVVMPGGQSPRELAEARAAAALGRHFWQAGVPVPAIYAFDPASGVLVMEDLGDVLLYHRLQDKPAADELRALYRQAIDALLSLQVSARPDFPADQCWDTPLYDRQLMLSRESGYFYQSLVRDVLGREEMTRQLSAEFARLADRAAAEPADFVLHRDYQCRNLMLPEGRVRIIDFQGARLGPLGYDLASLLYDPYAGPCAGLTPELREELLEYYLEKAEKLVPTFDRAAFVRGWYFLALQRNLQILGAFAFLSHRRGKIFFGGFIQPASKQLVALLTAPPGRDFPALRRLAREVQQQT